MKALICFMTALLIGYHTFGTSHGKIVKSNMYHVNYPVVGLFIAGGMVSDYFAISRIKNKNSISTEELVFLNSAQQRNLINPIDRWALRQNASDRKSWQQVSDYSMAPLILLPSLLMLDKNIRKDWLPLLMIYTQGHISTFTVYNYSFLGPTFQNRYRPMTYYSEFTDDARKSGNNRNSFYSGHVATVTYSTFFMAKVYCDYHPDMGAAKYLLYLAAAIPPVLMGVARTKSLDHFPSDDAVGFALGAIMGIIIPQLHKYKCSNQLSLSIYNSPLGNGLNVNWKLRDKHQLSLISYNHQIKN